MVSERDIKQAMRYLATRGYGRYVQGRHGRSCRFIWNADGDYVREKLNSEIANGRQPDAPEAAVRELIAELEKLLAKAKATLAQCKHSNSSARVDAVPNGALSAPTSSWHIPSEASFTAREAHALNPQTSLASVRLRLNEMVERGELEGVETRSGRVGRPVKSYAWVLPNAAELKVF